MRRRKKQFKKFIVATSILTIILQISYAQLLILLTRTAPYGITFATLAETFFWPEFLAFLEIAAVNVAAFLSKES